MLSNLISKFKVVFYIHVELGILQRIQLFKHLQMLTKIMLLGHRKTCNEFFF